MAGIRIESKAKIKILSIISMKNLSTRRKTTAGKAKSRLLSDQGYSGFYYKNMTIVNDDHH
jgi:hypothetical protein